MKKEKLIIGLTTIVLSLLIFIQELAISLYRYKLNNNNTKLIFSNDIYFFIGLFAIGLFVVLSRNSNNIIFTLIAIIAYLIFSILGIKNFNSFGNNLFYSIITLIYSILLSIGLRNKQIIVKEKLV
ncbi:MAG: hypothetical protein PQJ49_08060 [Sphaerochaetaceae bacterium]|nr:hypothetical protein [Sphaerochaetaceae bacterium]MDC7249852.1 hypothetical protein [Sphaerochaetaceae bacterium]